MTDGSHIVPTFRHVLGLSDSDRINFMNYERWLSYPVADKIISYLKDLMDRPKKGRMPNLLIVGPSNNGKSSIVKRFNELYGNKQDNDNEDLARPVVLTESTNADEKALYISILEQLYGLYRATEPVGKLRYQVIHRFRESGVRLLIIDEFHSLLTGSAIKQREVMNALKFMCNELAIPIIGVGTPEAVRVLHTDPQHASRFDVVRVPLWSADADFRRMLSSFEAILPLKKPSKLKSKELASKLFTISEGNLGDLHRLLVACATTAIEEGTEQITLDIINSKSWIRPTQGLREIRM